MPPKVASRRSKCPVCRDWVKPGENIRPVGDGDGKALWAHRLCAPNLDDIREWLEVGFRMAVENPERRVVLTACGGGDAGRAVFFDNAAAVASLLEGRDLPPNLDFGEGWREWLPGLPDSRFVPEGHSEEEAA